MRHQLPEHSSVGEEITPLGVGLLLNDLEGTRYAETITSQPKNMNIYFTSGAIHAEVPVRVALVV